MLAACYRDVRSSAAAAPSSSPPASIADVSRDDGEGPLRWQLRATLPEAYGEVSWLEATAERLVIEDAHPSLSDDPVELDPAPLVPPLDVPSSSCAHSV